MGHSSIQYLVRWGMTVFCYPSNHVHSQFGAQRHGDIVSPAASAMDGDWPSIRVAVVVLSAASQVLFPDSASGLVELPLNGTAGCKLTGNRGSTLQKTELLLLLWH